MNELISSPVAAATGFLLQLVQSRMKSTFVPILTFANNALSSNPTSSQRYGVLNIISILSPFITRHAESKSSMEGFMVQHVLPVFAAQEGFLRFIACWVVYCAETHNMKWANEEVSYGRVVGSARDNSGSRVEHEEHLPRCSACTQ